jgi:hypothetical protein
MELKVSSLAERPEMRERVLDMASSWPEFVTEDLVGNANYGRISGELPAYMTVSGSLEQWRRWTGLPFDTQGDIEVAGALVPVRCEPERGYAVYVEPNVWMRHAL